MAQMRAKELALPLVRSANTGPSALIDHQGVIVAKSEQFIAATLKGRLQPRSGETLFRTYGLWVIYLSLTMLICGAMLGRRLISKSN
jgi:apolipoprotein N-acyltransferase